MWTWEGPGNGGCRGLASSPLRSAADTLGGVRQDRGEDRGRRGREAGEERGEGPKLGPGDTIDRGRPNWPGQREGDKLCERRGEIAIVGRSGLPAGGLWTEEESVCKDNLNRFNSSTSNMISDQEQIQRSCSGVDFWPLFLDVCVCVIIVHKKHTHISM